MAAGNAACLLMHAYTPLVAVSSAVAVGQWAALAWRTVLMSCRRGHEQQRKHMAWQRRDATYQHFVFCDNEYIMAAAYTLFSGEKAFWRARASLPITYSCNGAKARAHAFLFQCELSSSYSFPPLLLLPPHPPPASGLFLFPSCTHMRPLLSSLNNGSDLPLPTIFIFLFH